MCSGWVGGGDAKKAPAVYHVLGVLCRGAFTKACLASFSESASTAILKYRDAQYM